MRPISDRRTLVGNVVSYTTLQAFQYLSPFLSLPLVTRALGTDRYGNLALTLAVCGYLNLWMDFGFGYSATREIAKLPEQAPARRQAFWSIQTCKLVLGTIGVLAIAASAHALASEPLATALIVGAAATAAGHLLIATWYWEGKQELKRLASVLLVGRLLQLMVVFGFVHDADDFYVALLADVAVNLCAGALLLPRLLAETRPMAIPSPELIARTLLANLRMFVANVSITLYTSANIVILALFAPAATVGVYALADRALTAAKFSLRPLSASMYPHLAHLAATDFPAYRRQWRSALLLFFAFGLAASIGTFLLAGVAIRLLGGPQYSEAIQLLRLLSPVPLLVALSNFFGVQTLLPLTRDRSFTVVLMTTSVFGVLLAISLAPGHAAPGVVIAAVASETIATLLMGISAFRVVARGPA